MANSAAELTLTLIRWSAAANKLAILRQPIQQVEVAAVAAAANHLHKQLWLTDHQPNLLACTTMI